MKFYCVFIRRSQNLENIRIIIANNQEDAYRKYLEKISIEDKYLLNTYYKKLEAQEIGSTYSGISEPIDFYNEDFTLEL
ncbi:MAG: hypothetical protein CMF62_01065 [Magnetococcales bacterium]|nr:hypothetical protein [Magnetococcales bacterium]|tara:strand:+ start:47536 stop:47772 length:237 start_codon:yes stop_codon:yes gene_type:complete